MVFSSTIFLFAFLPVVLILYYNPIFKGRRFRNVFLLLASLAFYGWGEPVFVFLMILSIIVTWLLGLGMKSRHAKAVLAAGISYHVVILFIFKYLTFSAEQIGLLIHKDLSAVSISLPIGISFFTFQLMSYLFDVYYKKAEAQRNPLYVGLYIALFPQLIAGPIVRYEKIASEITSRQESYDDVVIGMKRFIYGLAKKVLIANYVAQIADNVFDYLAGNTTVALAWLGAICYTFQIYFDFSGYSDMAIGLGRMFGFHFDENFNYPYIAKSVTEFWRRWHISLSSWFRDYVYIPLGGNRVGKVRWVFNLFIVWLLTGIWHGANWTFVIWGLLYFGVLLIEKLTGTGNRTGWFSHVSTMLIVIIAWVIFRADNLNAAVVYIGNMFGIGATGLWDSAVVDYVKATGFVLLAACIGVTPCVKHLFVHLRETKVRFVESVWVGLLFVLSILQVVSATYNPFIYFNF
jgi:D-alanyl-lipoteichoic acid acyltransferase DltB (MBOAT superfamily)